MKRCILHIETDTPDKIVEELKAFVKRVRAEEIGKPGYDGSVILSISVSVDGVEI